MSSTSADKKAREALRVLDAVRADYRLAKWAIVGSVLLAISDAVGWWFAISWSKTMQAGEDKGAASTGFFIALLIIAVIAVMCSIRSGEALGKKRIRCRHAQWEYEDSVVDMAA